MCILSDNTNIKQYFSSQKEAMGEKDDELDDAWLEKVARYFQPSEEHPLNCKSASLENEMSQVLPKRARIEEQPSYIPLCDISAAFKMEKSCQVEKKQNGGKLKVFFKQKKHNVKKFFLFH